MLWLATSLYCSFYLLQRNSHSKTLTRIMLEDIRPPNTWAAAAAAWVVHGWVALWAPWVVLYLVFSDYAIFTQASQKSDRVSSCHSFSVRVIDLQWWGFTGQQQARGLFKANAEWRNKSEGKVKQHKHVIQTLSSRRTWKISWFWLFQGSPHQWFPTLFSEALACVQDKPSQLLLT